MSEGLWLDELSEWLTLKGETSKHWHPQQQMVYLLQDHELEEKLKKAQNNLNSNLTGNGS